MKRSLVLGVFVCVLVASMCWCGTAWAQPGGPPGGSGSNVKVQLENYWHGAEETYYVQDGNHWCTEHTIYAIASYSGNPTSPTTHMQLCYPTEDLTCCKIVGGGTDYKNLNADDETGASGFLVSSTPFEVYADIGDGWDIYNALILDTFAKSGSSTPISVIGPMDMKPVFTQDSTPAASVYCANASVFERTNGILRMKFAGIQYLFNWLQVDGPADLEMQFKSTGGTWVERGSQYYISSTGVACEFFPDDDCLDGASFHGWLSQAHCLIDEDDLYASGQVTVRLVMVDDNGDNVAYWPSSSGQTIYLN